MAPLLKGAIAIRSAAAEEPKSARLRQMVMVSNLPHEDGATLLTKG
jgi:hypothetical protein